MNECKLGFWYIVVATQFHNFMGKLCEKEKNIH